MDPGQVRLSLWPDKNLVRQLDATDWGNCGVTEPTPGRTSSVARRRTGSVAAYEKSFGKLCAGTVAPLLAAAHLERSTAAGIRVLDAGTGTGSVAAVAASYGAEVTAVDSDEAMLAAASNRLPQATCLAADVTDLPFPDGRFDVVLANFVVNHLDDPRAGMAELSRVLAGDGAIALTIWASGPSVMKQLWDDVIVASAAVQPCRRLLSGCRLTRTSRVPPPACVNWLRGLGW